MEEDDETLIDIYQETAANSLTYTKQASRQPVPEYTLICDVLVTKIDVKKGAKAQIKINKQQ